MLTEMKNQLIKKAKEKNEIQFLEKPVNTSKIILLLNNNKVTRLLKEIKSSYEISNNLINELKNINNENPKMPFNELLLNCSDTFLRDPKYTNTIMTVLKKYYYLEYKENIFQNYWFTQEKFMNATLINFDEFKKK